MMSSFKSARTPLTRLSVTFDHWHSDNLRKDPKFKDDILEPIEVLGLDQFADSAVVIKARTKTQPIKQWNVAREFNRRLKKRFDEEKQAIQNARELFDRR